MILRCGLTEIMTSIGKIYRTYIKLLAAVHIVEDEPEDAPEEEAVDAAAAVAVVDAEDEVVATVAALVAAWSAALSDRLRAPPRVACATTREANDANIVPGSGVMRSRAAIEWLFCDRCSR